MRKYLRPAASLAVIGLFLLFALASFGPDASTNTTVAIENCKDTTAANANLKITVTYHWEDGSGSIEGAAGRLFIVHQKVDPDACTFTVVDRIEVDFFTNAEGKYVYNHGTTWVHDNTQDLIRVEVYGFGSIIDNYGRFKAMGVAYYGNGNFTFNNSVERFL